MNELKHRLRQICLTLGGTERKVPPRHHGHFKELNFEYLLLKNHKNRPSIIFHDVVDIKTLRNFIFNSRKLIEKQGFSILCQS